MKLRMALAVVLATATGLGSVLAPAHALPRVAPAAAAPASDVVQVGNRYFDRFRQYDQGNQALGNEHGHRPQNGNAWYNGHRGYRHARPGWRQHNGWWFPAAAFTLGIITAPRYRAPRPAYMPVEHYRWCVANYHTYNDYDNSFESSPGVRHQCRSPYWR